MVDGLYDTNTSLEEIVPSVASITEGVALNIFAALPEIVIVAEDVRLAPVILKDLESEEPTSEVTKSREVTVDERLDQTPFYIYKEHLIVQTNRISSQIDH